MMMPGVEEDHYIRKERYSGQRSRTFFAGEGVRQEDIKAKYEDGILKLSVPKEAPKQVEEERCISIFLPHLPNSLG